MKWNKRKRSRKSRQEQCVCSEGTLRVLLIVGLHEQKVNYMPQQKPLELLLSGEIPWNNWRQANSDVQAVEPDLRRADLHGAELQGADLHQVDLTEANLQAADLREANLREADLRQADIRNANLSDASLQRTLLRGVDARNAILCRANLRGADLSGANLRGADLSGADLKSAILDKTLFDETYVPALIPKRVDLKAPLDIKVQEPGSATSSDTAVPPRTRATRAPRKQKASK